MKYPTFIIAICCVIAIETLFYLCDHGNFSTTMKSPLLHEVYHQPVGDDPILVATKFDVFTGKDAEIIQIGDSSGMTSIKPELITPYLPKGWRYLNASLPLGDQFKGALTLADHLLRADKKRKVLVAMFSMFFIGSDHAGFGDEIAFDYHSLWRFVFALPSLDYRESLLRAVYYGQDPKESANALQSRVRVIHEHLTKSGGWWAANWPQPYSPHVCQADIYHPEVMRGRMESLVALAKHYNVTLVLALGPVHCEAGDFTRRIERDFSEFRRAHPEVIFPLPIYEQIPERYLEDDVHTTPQEGADYFSKIWGEALGRVLKTAL